MQGRVVGSASTSNRREKTDNEAVNPVPSLVSFAALCKDFVHLGGKPFQRSETIIEVQAWLSSCEKIFKSMRLSDEQKRIMAAWQLQGGAAVWWNSVTAYVSEDDMSWEEFKEMFEEKFKPAAGRTRLYQDFLNLKQGNMSIAEYETKFNELSCYGPGLIDTSLKKNEMFV